MFSKLLSATTVVLATTQLVAAQTSTACDPTKKTCPDDPALGTTVTVDFTKGKSDLFTAADGTTVTYDGNGAVFTINKAADAPTITSNKYIFFGKVELVVEAAPGAGIVTSFVLQSDDLDEIDWEWIGSDTTQVQSDYFGKGDTSTYDRGGYHSVSNPQSNYYTYTLDWTKDYVRWYINGQQVRELLYADAKGGTRFPQTPMQIKLGTWCGGGPDSPEGTAEWAGGRTDFSQAPFIAHYKTLTITDYSNGVKNAEKYHWPSGSDGSYSSIDVITGDGSSSSASSSASATSSAKSSATSGSSSATKTSETKSTLSTSTVSATSSASATSGSESSASSTATASGNNDSASASSSGSAAAANTSAPATTTSGALKTGFSVSALAAGLMVAFML
ncbi:glycoside hydrolase family 16 protein [Annulohypoxylon truncatum]|uniref:glycoside hydrolase family 16 protein n=1 Tax=Annulohypoxylon truncatum TaxID=327061 RepID=UPI002007D1DD|nr:glycoside hydrolase family 16 protein [Annulohypoxylon truncatum]KAI1204987.1 glycoside hydrolase family 16 protein [Annulohypoxylon truncatum]